MGRRKIEIQPLTDDRNRTVTFVKRKAGLFKKAHELAVLCQVDLAVIIVGNNNKLYEFSSVDTNELMNMYKKIPKPHESKSPANYGNYKKKKHLTVRSMGVINDDDMDDIDNHEDNSDYDSDTPEPKRQKRSFNDMTTGTQTEPPRVNLPVDTSKRVRPVPPNHISLGSVPTFNSFRNNVIKEEDEDDHRMPRQYRTDSVTSSNNLSRPVLRVQIPTDAKGSSNDSARTLTAMDTNLNPSSLNKSSKLQSSNDSSPDRSRADNDNDKNNGNNSNDSHGNNDTKNKNDMNSNNNNNPNTTNNSYSGGSSAGGPNLNALTPKYSSFSTFRSPATSKPITQLPIPIHSKSQTSSPSSATAPPLPNNNMTSFFNILPQPSPSSQFPNSSIQTPIYYQMMFNGDPKFRNLQQNNVNNPTNGNPGATAPGTGNGNPSEGPMSGLPSRYINDMFPSPSAFYVQQDWPNSGTGMTPLQHNVPQYFTNMMPNNQRGSQPKSSSQSSQPPTDHSQSTQPSHHPSSQNQGSGPPQLPPPGQNQYSLPSPLQFSGPTFQQDKK